MGKESKIGWTESTWNPWHGCQKVSAGCKNCYMFRDKKRWGQDGSIVQRSKAGTFNAPLNWKDPKVIFTCSWSDWFIEEADAWRDEAWAIIKQTPQHTYQILTKRPERIASHLPADWSIENYPNVWIGVSVENQAASDERLRYFADFDAAVKFISVEPLIDKVSLVRSIDTIFPNMDEPMELSELVNWVIIGGESGPASGAFKARDCKEAWIADVLYECKHVGIPVFIKQMGSVMSRAMGYQSSAGSDPDEWPEFFQVQEFPV